MSDFPLLFSIDTSVPFLLLVIGIRLTQQIFGLTSTVPLTVLALAPLRYFWVCLTHCGHLAPPKDLIINPGMKDTLVPRTSPLSSLKLSLSLSAFMPSLQTAVPDPVPDGVPDPFCL